MIGKSTVFTTDLRAKKPQDSQISKMGRLGKAIGLDSSILKNKIVAVKTHFGESGNTSFPRPILIRPIIDLIKCAGGKPFLAETTTLYTGARSNAIDHTELAIRHGFGIEVTGAPVFMCDGLTGRQAHEVEIEGKHHKSVSIAAGIHEADVLVVISHFKGHELTSFGGAIKNMGMGCGSRSGKLAMHTTVRPTVMNSRCVKCKTCFAWCQVNAISQPRPPDGPVVINPNICQGCGECLVSCRYGAIKINWSSEAGGVTERMVEHALGVARHKKNSLFCINILQNIVPKCDCMSFSDRPIVPDIGFAASTDPVALDACSLDMVNQETGIVGSALKNAFAAGASKFCDVHPELETRLQINYGHELKLGNKNYERQNLD